MSGSFFVEEPYKEIPMEDTGCIAFAARRTSYGRATEQSAQDVFRAKPELKGKSAAIATSILLKL